MALTARSASMPQSGRWPSRARPRDAPRVATPKGATLAVRIWLRSAGGGGLRADDEPRSSVHVNEPHLVPLRKLSISQVAELGVRPDRGGHLFVVWRGDRDRARRDGGDGPPRGIDGYITV